MEEKWFHLPKNQLLTCRNNLPRTGIFFKEWVLFTSRERETERKRDRETETDRHRERQREIERQRETEREI